jgi:D-alanyl-D-alanine carboxypeptidase
MTNDIRVQHSASYLEELRIIHRELGIPEDCRLGRQGPIFLENGDLVRTGSDLYNRDLYLAHAAAEAWLRMQSAARQDGINLIAVSGFRSVRRQQEIIISKLSVGQHLTEILRTNAAPGHSQHHTGFTLDVADDSNCEPLSEAFERQAAFQSLSRHADVHDLSV